MLTDPDQPMLPLPTANLVTRPPFKDFGDRHPVTHWAPVVRGNLHLWRSLGPDQLLHQQAFGGDSSGTCRPVSILGGTGRTQQTSISFSPLCPPS